MVIYITSYATKRDIWKCSLKNAHFFTEISVLTLEKAFYLYFVSLIFSTSVYNIYLINSS